MFTDKKTTPPMTSQQQQLEKLKEIGSQMRQVRTEKSVSIDEVATKTRIQARLLVAIEEGNIDHLPEPVYIQGLIKQFAEALGLNGLEYAGAFPTGKQTYTINPSWRQLPAAQLRPLHLYVIYILLIIASVSGLSYLIEQRSAQNNTQSISEEQVREQPVDDTLKQQLATAQPTSPTETSSNDDPKSVTDSVEVKVSVQKEAWIKITSDGETVYEGVMRAGDQQTWQSEEALTLRTGNAGGVVVEYNEQSPTVIGELGEVKEVTYSPKS